jgi:UDP-glucuronate 4-epimerase
MPVAFVTGTAGFIGFHLARLLLAEGWTVAGYDGITPYYDVTLKRARHGALLQSPGFSATEAMLEDDAALVAAVEAAAPDVIVHLAAQAGVRYSLENPRAYVDANLTGTFNLLQAARAAGVRHCLIASTSSVYGANPDMPFRETDKADMPMTLYAATKRATEHMAHAQAHLWGLPVTALRFFTVYGPWGRPDMALFKFVSAALQGEAIDVYNHGDMRRDFTHVDDLVRAIRLLIDTAPPVPGEERAPAIEGDSLSPVAPFRVVNIGNSAPEQLIDFIAAIEDALGKPIRRNLLPMQPGDVPATWADCGLLLRLTGFRPDTDIRDGVAGFVEWYRAYYGV